MSEEKTAVLHATSFFISAYQYILNDNESMFKRKKNVYNNNLSSSWFISWYYVFWSLLLWNWMRASCLVARRSKVEDCFGIVFNKFANTCCNSWDHHNSVWLSMQRCRSIYVQCSAPRRTNKQTKNNQNQSFTGYYFFSHIISGFIDLFYTKSFEHIIT